MHKYEMDESDPIIQAYANDRLLLYGKSGVEKPLLTSKRLYAECDDTIKCTHEQVRAIGNLFRDLHRWAGCNLQPTIRQFQ